MHRVIWVTHMPNTFLRLARELATNKKINELDVVNVLNASLNIAARNCSCFPFIHAVYDYLESIPVGLFITTDMVLLIQKLESVIYKLLMLAQSDVGKHIKQADIVNMELTMDLLLVVQWQK
jgi:hypothetical protein